MKPWLDQIWWGWGWGPIFCFSIFYGQTIWSPSSSALLPFGQMTNYLTLVSIFSGPNSPTLSPLYLSFPSKTLQLSHRSLTFSVSHMAKNPTWPSGAKYPSSPSTLWGLWCGRVYLLASPLGARNEGPNPLALARRRILSIHLHLVHSFHLSSSSSVESWQIIGAVPKNNLTSNLDNNRNHNRDVDAHLPAKAVSSLLTKYQNLELNYLIGKIVHWNQ